MIPGIVEASRWLPSFSDTFNRANAASLATTNLDWVDIVGDWDIASNTAYSATTAVSYPLAAIESLRQDVTVTAFNGGSGAGFGVAFWVADANNWWAVVSDVVTTQASGTVYTCPSGGTLSGTTCINTCYQTCYQTCCGSCCSGGSCPSGGSGACDGNNVYTCSTYNPGGCSCDGYNCGGSSPQSPGGAFNCGDGGCQACRWEVGMFGIGVSYNCYPCTVVPPSSSSYTGNTTYTSCNCGPCNPYACNPYSCNYAATATTQTITTYTHSFKLIKKEAGVLSVVATQSHGAEQTTPIYFTSLTVTTNGSAITWSGLRNGLTNSGSASGTPAAFATKHGIILSPTTAGAQSTQVDRFDYTV